MGFACLTLLFNCLENTTRSATNDYTSNLYNVFSFLYENDYITKKEHDFLNEGDYCLRKIRNLYAHKNIAAINFVENCEESEELWPLTENDTSLMIYSKISDTLTEIAGNEFKLQLTNQRCNSEHSRNVSARVSFADYMESAKPIKQIAIYASDGHSAGFSLMPTQWDREKDWTPDWAAGCHNEMLTLWDDDAYSYLLYFFAKHCSSDFPDWIWGDWDDHDDSDEDIIYNRVISYELMEIIIADIRSVIHLLKTDYDHPNLAGIKEMFDSYSFDRMYVYKNPTPENDEIIRNNVDVVIHFYERFCWLAENMMQNAPQYRFISIWGD